MHKIAGKEEKKVDDQKGIKKVEASNDGASGGAPSAELLSKSAVESTIPSEQTLETYSCSFCSKLFHKKELLKRHTRYECELVAKCDETPAVAPSKALEQPKDPLTREDTKKESNPKLTGLDPDKVPETFACTFCPKVFNKKEMLKRHTRYECGLEMQPRGSLPKVVKEDPAKGALPRIDSHRATELKDKSSTTESLEAFKCSHCRKTFSKKEHLKRHKRYECSLSVAKPTKEPVAEPQSAPVPNHVPSQPQGDDQEDLVCPFCSKTFTKKDLLKRHTRYECGQESRSYDGTSCPHCSYKAPDKQTLNNHIGLKHYVPW